MKHSLSLLIRTWRKSCLMDQKSLAARLGVTQSAISRWETGADIPSKAMIQKLKDIMAENDPVRVERAMIERQGIIRAIFDADGVRMLCHSRGLSDFWPEFAKTGASLSLRDHLANEMQVLFESDEFMRHAATGEIAFVSGVSDRHTHLPLDASRRHRWHIQCKRHGFGWFGDVIYEPCDPDVRTGIEVIHYHDDLGASI